MASTLIPMLATVIQTYPYVQELLHHCYQKSEA